MPVNKSGLKNMKVKMPILEGGSKAKKLIHDMNSISNEISRKEWEFAKRLQTLHNLLRIEQASPFLCENKSCPISRIFESVTELLNCYDEVLDERTTLIKTKKEFQDLVTASDDEDDKEDETTALPSPKKKKNKSKEERRVLVVASRTPDCQ